MSVGYVPMLSYKSMLTYGWAKCSSLTLCSIIVSIDSKLFVNRIVIKINCINHWLSLLHVIATEMRFSWRIHQATCNTVDIQFVYFDTATECLYHASNAINAYAKTVYITVHRYWTFYINWWKKQKIRYCPDQIYSWRKIA